MTSTKRGKPARKAREWWVSPCHLFPCDKYSKEYVADQIREILRFSAPIVLKVREVIPRKSPAKRAGRKHGK